MSEAVNKPKRQTSGQQIGVMTFAQMVHYRLPVSAYVSGFHRISGLFLFLFLPFLLFILDKSLMSEVSFNYLKGFVSHWFVKLIILGLSWAYLHHFCAGLRHMQQDFHVGLDKATARKTSIAVFVISLLLTAGVAWKLFGASNG